MRSRTRIGSSALAVAMAVGSQMTTARAVTEEPARHSACAAFDLHILTALEDQQRSGAIPSAQLVVIFERVNEARIACREGRVADALAIYEMIDTGPRRYGFLR